MKKESVKTETTGDDTTGSATVRAEPGQPEGVLPGLGLFLIAGGIISLLLSIVENPIGRGILITLGVVTFVTQRVDLIQAYWGGMLFVMGILAFRIQRRGMFIVIGAALILASLLNFFGGKFAGWTLFGIPQLLLSLLIISMFRDYPSRKEMKTIPSDEVVVPAEEVVVPEKPVELSFKPPEPKPESPPVGAQPPPREPKIKKDNPQAWRSVRVFISSTFRDMHAERDYLVKVVFPELRERMAQRRLHLVDIDLRWGITEAEAEHGKVLEICLDEIERSRPFFISILGERYGSVLDSLPEDAEFTYPWLAEYAGHSLTALEIVHGVLRKPDLARRSFSYFRDPQFISQIPESKRADFIAENAESEHKISALKNAIRASGRPVMESYPARWDEREGRVVDLDRFGRRVLEDLWTAICTEYPEEVSEADPLTVERGMHEAFVEERSHLHIGRGEQARRLTEYVGGTDRRPVVITGEPGCGKSAFLANWYRQYAAEYPDSFVLASFVGASPASSNHFRLLRNICEELKRTFALKEEIPEDDKKLSETLAVLLHAASQGTSKIVLVLDALDQLLPLEAARGLGWLLDYIPEKVHLVMSASEGDCLEVLRRRQVEEVPLLPLTADEQRQIVQVALSEWGRKLDERQMEVFLTHPGVSNPLYLRVALEELRLFGSFEQLTERIERLPPDIAGLFDQVLARLEEDHEIELVAEAFSLLGCSRFGLSEPELLTLLQREEEQLPRALWVRLARGAKAYLVQRGELIGFFHRQLADAAAARYLSQENRHAKLAAYFAYAPIERKLDEYSYQLQQVEDWKTLAGALSDLDFLKYAWDHDREYEWIGFWQSLRGHFDPASCYQLAISEKQRETGETSELVRLLDIVGLLLCDMAYYPSAIRFHKHALTIRIQVLGHRHLEVADNLYHMGLAYQRQDRPAYAQSCYSRALAIYENDPAADPLKKAACYDSLSPLQLSHDEQLFLARRALAIREQIYGPDHATVVQSLTNIATVYLIQRKYNEAFPLAQRALEIRERTLGPDHPDVVSNLSLVGAIKARLLKRGEAGKDILTLDQRSLAIRERFFGPDHPDTGISIFSLASYFYNFEHNYKEAQVLYERCLMIFRNSDSRNSYLLLTLHDLANCYIRQYKLWKVIPLVPLTVRSILTGLWRSGAKLFEHPAIMFLWGLLLFTVSMGGFLFYPYPAHQLYPRVLWMTGCVVGAFFLARFWRIVRSESIIWKVFFLNNLSLIGAFILPLPRIGILNGLYMVLIVYGGGIAYFRWPGLLVSYGLLLLLPALLNIMGGPFDGWTLWGVVQLLVGLYLVIRYWRHF